MSAPYFAASMVAALLWYPFTLPNLPNLIVLGLTVEERLSSTLILYQNSAQELTSSERKRLSATSTSMSYLIHILSLIASLIRVSTGVLAKMR